MLVAPSGKLSLVYSQNFVAWSAPHPLDGVTEHDLRSFVDAKLAAGYHASTLRRRLKMLRAHYRRLYLAGDATPDTYLALRSVELPPDGVRL